MTKETEIQGPDNPYCGEGPKGESAADAHIRCAQALAWEEGKLSATPATEPTTRTVTGSDYAEHFKPPSYGVNLTDVTAPVNDYLDEYNQEVRVGYQLPVPTPATDNFGEFIGEDGVFEIKPVTPAAEPHHRIVGVINPESWLVESIAR